MSTLRMTAKDSTYVEDISSSDQAFIDEQQPRVRSRQDSDKRGDFSAVSLRAHLQKQFALAQEHLAAHHEQVLSTVDKLCTTGSAPTLIDNTINSLVPFLHEPDQLDPIKSTQSGPFLSHSSTQKELSDNLAVWQRSSNANTVQAHSSHLHPSTPHKCTSLLSVADEEMHQSIKAKPHQRAQIRQSMRSGEVHENDGWRRSTVNRGSSDEPKGAVFMDAAAMKEKVRLAVMRPDYNVANFYHEEGTFQWIARSQAFESITLTVIAINSIWIAIDTDMNTAPTLFEARTEFQLGENFFCIYFLSELTIRFASFRRKMDCIKDSWFVFDSCLVVMMVLETWVMNLFILISTETNGDGSPDSAVAGDASVLRLVRLLRLTRMARMMRLLRAMPELMILVKGISAATRSVFFTLCLLFIIIYVFSIAFTQLAEGSELESTYFDSVPKSMYSLLVEGVLPDQSTFVSDVSDAHPLFAVLLLLFILLSTLTVMNMLIGVLVEVVSVVSSVEKELMTVSFVKSKLQMMLEDKSVDQDGDKLIDKQEFEELLLNPRAARILDDVGVDVVGLVDFSDHIFEKCSELTFEDFMELVLQLRGSNEAKVRDIVHLRKHVSMHCNFMVQEIQAALEKGPRSERIGAMSGAGVADLASQVASQVASAIARESVRSQNSSPKHAGLVPARTEPTLVASHDSKRVLDSGVEDAPNPMRALRFAEPYNPRSGNMPHTSAFAVQPPSPPIRSSSESPSPKEQTDLNNTSAIKIHKAPLADKKFSTAPPNVDNQTWVTSPTRRVLRPHGIHGHESNSPGQPLPAFPASFWLGEFDDKAN